MKKLKEFKKFKIWILILVIIGIITIVLGVLFNSNTASNNSKDDNKQSDELIKIKSLIKKDYDISNYMYGSPSVSEESITFDGVTYYRLENSSLKDLRSYQKLINDIYTDNLLTTSLINISKYNKYVEAEDNLYVNINSKCNIDKFDDKITIVDETDDEITVKTNNREIAISKDGNIYKLKDSAYNCK